MKLKKKTKLEKQEAKLQKELEKSKRKAERKKSSAGFSWRTFVPFTKEHKALVETKKDGSGKKPRKKFRFEPYFKRAGFDFADEKKIKKALFNTAVAVSLLLSVFVIASASMGGKRISDLLIFMAGYWSVFFVFVILFIAFFTALYLDIRAYRRTKELEAVLPDFLQLASANINAGMPIDRALWFAVRPNFGILAKEVEEVAKSTYTGKDLGQALRDFASKFDSKVLDRAVSLLLEGMAAGGEMAELLNKIALNIEETNILRKEMAANVTTYAIFIGGATLIGAPFLFGLATQLLIIIQDIAATVGGTASSSSGMFSFSITSNAVKIADFKAYSLALLLISSFFSGAIISVIRKGNVKEGAVTIPVFMAVTVLLYYVFSAFLGGFMGAFF